MQLFHLTIGRRKAKGAYSVELRSSAGDAVADFSPPFRGRRLTTLLRRVTAGKLSQGDELQDIGSKLFDRLFKQDVLARYKESVAAAKGNGPLRIVLSLTAGELHRYPWELMYDGSQFLAASGHMQLLRRIGLAAPRSSVIVPPLRVLVAVGDPIDVLPDLDVQREVAWIASAVHRRDAYVEIQPAMRHILQSRLREGGFDVFHFTGHGAFAGKRGYLCFEKDNSCVDPVPADVLKALLQARGVPVVVLCACGSAMAPGQDVFSGVAQALVQGGIPAVVAMGSSVSDAGGSALAREFYETLQLEYDVAAAITETRIALYADRLDWHAPILYTLHVETPVLQRGSGTREQLAETSFALDVSLRPSVPLQLGFPSAIQFTKRWEQEKLADALLASRPRIVTVDGPPGSGKTALAAEMARRLAWAFTGGVLGVSCEVSDTLEAILARINEQLLSAWDAQVDLAQPWGRNLLLNALRERAYLLILDNFETVLQGRGAERRKILDFLTEIPSPSKAVVTSRQTLDLGQRVRVETLAEDTFAVLLARIGKRRAIPPFDDDLRLRAELVAADPKRKDDLLTHAERYLLQQAHAKLGGLPWAAEVFMGLVAQGEDIADLLADLAPLHRKMSPLLDMSYERLSEGAQELLLLMSIFYKPVHRGAIGAVSVRADWEVSLEELIGASLVTSNKYSLHPLIKQYAVSKLTDKAVVRAAHKRAAEYFLREDDQDALVAIDHFYHAEEWPRVVELANALAEPLHTAGLWGEAREKFSKAVRAARAGGDQEGEATSLLGLGNIYSTLGGWDEAIELYNKALKIMDQVGHIHGMGTTYLNVGTVHVRKGEWDEAIELYKKALKIMEQVGDTDGVATTYMNLGTVHARKGEWAQAIELLTKSLKINEQVGDIHGMAQTYTNLGGVHLRKGEWDEAIELYTKSLEIMEQVGDIHGTAQTLGSLGLVYADKGQWDEAIELYTKSLEIMERLGDIHGMGQTLGNLGLVYADKGQWDEAIELYNKDLEISERLGDIHGVAHTLGNLGGVHLRKGEWDEAIELYSKAVKIMEQVGDRHGTAKNLGNLGSVYLGKGQWAEAIELYNKSLQIKEQIGDIHGMAQTWANLATLYESSEDYATALEYIDKALEVFKQLGTFDLQHAEEQAARINEELAKSGKQDSSSASKRQ